MKYLVILAIFFLVISINESYAEVQDYDEWIVDGYTVLTKGSDVLGLDLNWNSQQLAEGSITLSDPYTGPFEIRVPKSMPRTMNLDFETSTLLVVHDRLGYGHYDDTIVETDSECYYVFSMNLENVEYFEIVTASVAVGRWEPVAIHNEKCNDLSSKSDSQNGSVFPRHGYQPSQIMSPLNQLKSKVPVDEIQCKENLVLIQKYDNSPACVKFETFSKLVNRGWTKTKINFESDSLQQAILSHLRTEHQNITGVAKDFVVYEALHDKILSEILLDTDYETDCCSYSNNSSEITIAFWSDQKQMVVTVQYNLEQEKITKIDTNPIRNGIKVTFAKNPQDPQNPRESFTTIKPNSVEYFYYPESSESSDKYKLFMLIRLPEWMGGAQNNTSAFRAYSAKSLDDPCIVKYWPDEGRQDIENPCQGGMYRVVDGAMTYGAMYSSIAMTALPHLDLSMDDAGMLHVEPPKFTKTENGVVGYGRQMTLDEIRDGSKFMIDSFAKHYPDYPSIPLEFAGFLLSDILPEKYSTTVKYLDFQGKTGYITMEISEQTFHNPSYADFTEPNKEFWQIGDTIIKISNTNNHYKNYLIKFQAGHNYTIEGNNLESIKKSIVKNFFPQYSYDDLFLVSSTME